MFSLSFKGRFWAIKILPFPYSFLSFDLATPPRESKVLMHALYIFTFVFPLSFFELRINDSKQEAPGLPHSVNRIIGYSNQFLSFIYG